MTTPSLNVTASRFVTMLSGTTGGLPPHEKDSATSATIKYIYVSIGAVGCLGNLVVILIMAFYTSVAQKVSNSSENIRRFVFSGTC
jgi:hypothetical protein